jgi:wyosine [tRNA(Phe)-imidazoG37] synthetase (radical SAM superfamily)
MKVAINNGTSATLPLNHPAGAAAAMSTPGFAPPLPRPQSPAPRSDASAETAFGCPRDFLDNRFVYLVLSPRARGLSAGVNLNPDGHCNFNCVYCEVDRSGAPRVAALDVSGMTRELKRTLDMVYAGRLRELPRYSRLPDELLQLRHVTLSGDGEPTLAPNFTSALEAVLDVRTSGGFPFFKLVVVTNATALDLPEVQSGLGLLSQADEVWAKLDGGTREYLNKVSGVDVPLEHILENILKLGRRRPVVIQSLFPAINGCEPPLAEIVEYARRLKDLKAAGARISLVQIYSATRPTHNPACGHLPLKSLFAIAQIVKVTTGLKVEVF